MNEMNEIKATIEIAPSTKRALCSMAYHKGLTIDELLNQLMSDTQELEAQRRRADFYQGAYDLYN